jgi:STE24 endopeptidase
MSLSSLITADAVAFVFAGFLLASTVVRYWLASRQMRHVARHRHEVPAAFAGAVSLAAHQKAADYTLAKGRLSMLAMAVSAAVLLGWTLLGGLDTLNTALVDHLLPALKPLLGDAGAALAYQLALLAAFVAIGSLIELPIDAYGTFVIEERFGFNRTPFKLWLADLAKGTVLGAALGLPIAAAVLWLMGHAGSAWWLWAWLAWVGFNLLLMVIYPTWIAPLFNRFEPLADEGLKARVNALMQRCGFAAKGLFVMDGSRRSAHGNAYFTGLGTSKRVVFYDTLLQRLAPAEVEAVLAHELGHFKHRHVAKRVLLLMVLSGAAAPPGPSRRPAAVPASPAPPAPPLTAPSTAARAWPHAGA